LLHGAAIDPGVGLRVLIPSTPVAQTLVVARGWQVLCMCAICPAVADSGGLATLASTCSGRGSLRGQKHAGVNNPGPRYPLGCGLVQLCTCVRPANAPACLFYEAWQAEGRVCCGGLTFKPVQCGVERGVLHLGAHFRPVRVCPATCPMHWSTQAKQQLLLLMHLWG
jgi:hypothetical protein